MNKMAPKIWLKSHAGQLRQMLFFVSLFLLGTLLAYYRYPLAFSRPNFYAEDGDVLMATLRSRGLWRALGTSFNGYYQWGHYLLAQLALIVNRIVYGGSFLAIPKSIAFVSYMFLAFLATLPILLFHRLLRPGYLATLAVLTIFVPLREWDYAIIGIIGDWKFAFVYIALLLTTYRLFMKPDWKWVIVTDIGLLICGYTALTVYVLLPIIAGAYIGKLWRRGWSSWKGTLLTVDFGSFAGLCLGLLVQLVLIKLHGIPDSRGYLDSPYQYSKSIEIFAGRSYVYAILYWSYQKLTNFSVGIISLVTAAVGWLYSPRSHRPIILLAVYTLAMTTLLTIISRPGIGAFFGGYKDVGPEQFFYAQNLMVYFALIIFIQDIYDKYLKTFWRWVCSMILLICLALALPYAGTYGADPAMQNNVGDINQNAQRLCTNATTPEIDLPVYPNNVKPLKVLRSELCSDQPKRLF